MLNKMLKLALATVLAFTSVFTTSIVNHTAVVEAASEAVFKSTAIATINNGSGAIVADADAINAVKNLNDFTMNAKIKLTGTSTVQSVFFLGDSSNSSNNYVSIWMNKSNTVGIESFNASGSKQIGVSATSSVAFNDEQEHYFTFRYTKGGKFQVFIDGVKAAELNASVAFSNGFFSDSATMYLGFGMGARKSGNNYPFTGTIGAVECYDRAISDVEVSDYIARNAELSSLVWKVENVAEATSTTEFAGINTLTKGAVTVRYRAKEANTGMISLFKLSNGSQYAEVYVNPSQNKVGYKTADKDMNMTKVGTGASDASLSINDTEWHTFSVRYDGTKVYFYLDDVQFASNIFWTYGKWLASVSNATELSYGASNAYVESIRVHNEMLSADDFQKIQNQYAFESKLVDGMEGAYVTEPIDLFYPGLDGSSAYRIPSLLTTDKGTVIAGIDQRYTGTGDAGNIDTVVRRREKGSDTWGECIDVVDLVDNNGSTPSAFMIDPSMVQDRETGRIFLLVDMYPHSSGLMNTGILVSGDGYEEINGVEYQEVFQDTVKFGTIREDGVVYDNDGNKTDYVVIRECEAPYKELGNVYYKGEYAGNAFIYDGANKGAIQIARTSYLWLTYSDDDGKTWSCPKDITPMVKFDYQGFLGTGPGVGLQLQDGTLCFPVYGARNENLGGSQASAIIYSTDGGETWTQGKSPVTAYDTPLDPATMADGGKIVTESQMVQLNNGTVLLFMRNYSGTVRVATSTDGGKTWDKIENTPIYDCYCQLSVLHYNNNGKEYVIMSNPGAAGRNVGAINLAEVNADGTLTWKYKNIIEPGRYLYSCLTLLDKDAEGDQVFGLIYEYEPNSMYLKYVEFDEKWITNPEVMSTRPVMEVEDYLVEQNGTTYDVTVTFNQPVIVFPNATLTTTKGNFAFSRRLANNAVVFTGTIEQLDDVVTATGFEGIIENEVAEQAEVSFEIAKPEADKVVMSGAVASTQASSSTAEAQDGAGVNAIDGNPLTYWHSRYASTDSLPQDIVITLAQETPIYKMEYLPRQNSQSGRVKDYEVYVSTNGTDYTKVTSGTFTTGTDLQSVEFAPATAKYVKFVALTSTAKESCAIAELAFYAYEDGIYETASDATVATLEAKLAEIIKLQEDTKYSSVSKAGLITAQEALQLLANSEQPYSEAMATNAIANADKAIAKLVDITAAKVAYEAAIAKTNNNEYTDESWTAYQTALEGLLDIVNTAQTTRALTDVQMKIKYAESQLVEKDIDTPTVDKTALEALIVEVEALNEADYSRKSWSNLQTALTAAKEAETQEAVDAAKAELEAKKAALVNVVAMKEAIATAKEKLAETDKYTSESLAALQTVVSNAEFVLGSNVGYYPADVEMHVTSINNAIVALVEKPEELTNLINKAANEVTVESYSSQCGGAGEPNENGTGQASATVDYNEDTYWHSNWQSNNGEQHTITYNLGKVYSLTDVTFLPRKGGRNGDIHKFEVYVGNNTDYTQNTLVGEFVFGENGPLTEGQWYRANIAEKGVFEGQYVTIRVTGSYGDSGNNKFASMSEIRFYGDEVEVPSVDKAALNALITEMETLAEANYSKRSWSNLQSVLTAAKAVANNTDVTQEEVDAATANLTAKKEALVNISALNEAIATAKAKLQEADKYTEESVSALQSLLATAEYVVGTTIGYYQEDADMHTTNLNNAIAALQEKAPAVTVDKAALNEAIAAAEALAEADYSRKSWSNLQTALTAAKDVVADENATQEVVDQAKAGLEAKQAALVNVVAMREAIAAAEAKLAEADKYTDETVAELTTAYNNAVYAINSNIGYVQADADMHAANINNAISALVEKPVEPELTAPAKVENVKAKDTNYKTITLTWEASETATAYDVYRKAYDSEEFKLYKTVEDTTVAVTGVMTGKEYAFYVVAKNEAGVAEASATVAKATTLHGEVTLDIEQVSTSTFKLSWNKIDGATRYIVYRKRNDDKMKKVLTLGAKETEYVTAEMPNGDYQFILKAGRYDSKDRVMTDSSNTVEVSVEKVAPAVTLKAGTKSIKVSWKAMEGVTHYQVYRATSEDGKYTKLITTKELSYTAKSLKSGKKYFFKVRGYKTYKSGTDIKYTVYTPYSTIKYATAK